jgi:acid phosphatase type 7
MTRGCCALLVVVLGLSAAGTVQAEGPPQFEVPAGADQPITFVVYGDTRFSPQAGVANPLARRALVARIAAEHPLAIMIGGDLVYDGSSESDYATYADETAAWSQAKLPVFVALGNHEFHGCEHDQDLCLEHWWTHAAPPRLKPYRWYSVRLGAHLLALVLDSDSALKRGSAQRDWFEQQVGALDPAVQFLLVIIHYPPVKDPLFPRGRDEKEIASYFAKHARALHARVVVVGSHVHNYERYARDGVTYLVSGGGGAKPILDPRLPGELSRLRTSVNFHYLRFHLENGTLRGTMVRFEADDRGTDPWSEPDHFEVSAR